MIVIISALIIYNIYPKYSDIDFFISDNQEQEYNSNIVDFLNPHHNLNSDQQLNNNIKPTAKNPLKPLDMADINNDITTKLKQQILELQTQIKRLTIEVANLKSRAIKEDSDILSIILIELYQVKNLAILGKEFRDKIPALIKLSVNYPNIIKSLSNIEKLAILATKPQLYEQILVAEENLIKKLNKQNYQEKNSNFIDKIKYYFANYVKIKQVKNLTMQDPLYKIKQIRENIRIDNYLLAQKILQKLALQYKMSFQLESSLENLTIFMNEFSNINQIILNKPPQETLEIAL